MTKQFDIQLSIEAKVLPREIPTESERRQWAAVQQMVDHHALALANSLRRYLEIVTRSAAPSE